MQPSLDADFLRWAFGMFLHFNVATFNEREWANGYEDPLIFAPDRLDCGQWADAAVAAGMGYAVLTVKHTGGWCLWESGHTTHDVAAFTNYKAGKGDVVREFVDAFRGRGLRIGLYYCFPGDYGGPLGVDPPRGSPDLHGLPPEARGDYVGFIRKQLAELLTDYGEIDLVWIDQYANEYTRDHWRAIRDHIKNLQPRCIVIANNSHDSADTDIHGWEYPYLKHGDPADALPPEDNVVAAEVCDTIGPSWFWNGRESEANVRSADEIVATLKLCNARRANYLLNVAPDRTGRIPTYSVERLREVGRRLAEGR